MQASDIFLVLRGVTGDTFPNMMRGIIDSED